MGSFTATQVLYVVLVLVIGRSTSSRTLDTANDKTKTKDPACPAAIMHRIQRLASLCAVMKDRKTTAKRSTHRCRSLGVFSLVR